MTHPTHTNIQQTTIIPPTIYNKKNKFKYNKKQITRNNYKI